MSEAYEHGLVSPSDIAEIAQVSRAAVSNWRERSEGFPKPVAGSPSRPLFALDEVILWLRANRQGVRLDVAGGSAWAAMNSVRGVASVDDAAYVVAVLAAIRKAESVGMLSVELGSKRILDADPAELANRTIECANAVSDKLNIPVRGRFEQIVRQLDTGLRGLVAAVAATEVSVLAASVDFILERTSKSMIKAGAELGYVGSRTSALLCSLVGPSAKSVYDPACGIATALVCAGRDRGELRLVGHEINVGAAELAQLRAFLHDVEIELRIGNVIQADPDSDLRVDVVIAEPPFGLRWNPEGAISDPRFSFGAPSPSSADLAWIQHAITHLNEYGRAFVLTAPGATLKSGADAKIRAALVTAGCVEAIIGLPSRMLMHTAIAPTLWVLRRPRDAGSVLFIDASEVADVESKVATWMGEGRFDALSEDVSHARVNVAEILAADAELVPARWVAQGRVDYEGIARSFATAVEAVRENVRMLSGLQGGIPTHLEASTIRTNTIEELLKAGVVDVLTGLSRPEEGIPVVTPAVIRLGHLGDETRGGGPGERRRTLPGDVLLTTTHEIRTLVDRDGGHLVGPGVDVLRVRNPEVLSPDYVAAVLTGSWNQILLAGTTIQRVPVRRLEVPIIPIEQQRRLEAVHGTVRSLSRQAEHLRDQAGAVRDAILDGVRYGVDLDAAAGVAGVGQDGDNGQKEGV